MDQIFLYQGMGSRWLFQFFASVRNNEGSQVFVQILDQRQVGLIDVLLTEKRQVLWAEDLDSPLPAMTPEEVLKELSELPKASFVPIPDGPIAPEEVYNSDSFGELARGEGETLESFQIRLPPGSTLQVEFIKEGTSEIFNAVFNGQHTLEGFYVDNFDGKQLLSI